MRDDTLIVSASYDGSYPEWFERLPDPKVRMDTSEGGYQSRAYVNAFHFDRMRHHSYLFVQDSMEPVFPAPVSLFRAEAEIRNTPVVGWARFPLFFDSPEQELRVTQQYPWVKPPEFGIFGPVFYVERKVLETLNRLGRFPKTAENKMDANGTERAWAFAFEAIGVKPAFLHDWSEEFLASGDAAPFRKVYAGRQ